MPVSITDADTFTTTVEAIADGEALNSTNLRVSVQDLADRTKFLYNRGVLRFDSRTGVAASTTSTTMVDLAGGSISFSLTAGDIVQLHLATANNIGAVADNAQTRIAVVDPAAVTTGLTYTVKASASGAQTQFLVIWHYVATTTGTHTFKVQHASTGGLSVTNLIEQFVAMAFKPHL